MKYTFKYLVAFSLTCLIGLSSCSDSWFEGSSTEAATDSDIFKTTQNARQVVNGLCRIMVQQHSKYGQSFNGEGTMKLLYGEYPGQDFFFPYMAPGWYPIMKNESSQTLNNSIKYDSYPWYYYYLIIGNANSIIARIDNAEGTQEERDFLKAEALTFRAYSFFRLSEVYCNSWKKSNNGATEGVILRLDEISNAGQSTSMPRATLAETYKRIYDDLDKALELYQSSGITREKMYSDANSQVCYPDAKVAHAIYARAALTREDYAVALRESKLAQVGHELMDVSEYRSGFCNPNNEWIWGVYNNAAETIWYYGWQLYMACNGYYAANGYNVCISRSLAESFEDGDIRKGLFLTESTFMPANPDTLTYLHVVYEDDADAGRFTEEKNSFGTIAADKANAYAQSVVPSAEYQTYSYASLKFQATALPAVGSQPIMRSSEMLLIEAEANHFLNNDVDAQNNLIALNKTSLRDKNYECTKTGTDLLNEIKKYRRLELWGEGFSWFDCKRWGDPVVRPGFKDGGNYSSFVSGTYGFDDKGNYVDTFWKWILPSDETNYNDAFKP